MNQSTFQNLIKKATCDTGNERDTVGFTAKHQQHELIFFGEAQDGHQVTIDTFGKMYKKKWIRDTPSQTQLNTMQKHINNKVDSLN